MKKKIICIIAIILLGAVVAFFATGRTSLIKQIDKNLGSSDNWKIQSIEKMEKDKDPVVHDITEEADGYDELVKEIEKSDLKRAKYEPGMEIISPLYTMTVSDGQEYVTFTVNDKKEIHVNQKDVTYKITDEKSGLYNSLEQVYDSAK